MMTRSGLLLLAVLPLATSVAEAEELRIWTLTETRRVLRDEAPEAAGPPAVAVAAARKEWRSFQILIRSDEPKANINIEPEDLRGSDGAIAPAKAARLYRQHAFEITESSPRNEDFRPGWYPDALIPFQNPMTGEPLTGARLQAVPFDLPAGETHGFLVDLYVPEGLKAGTYKGVYRVLVGDDEAAKIPVELTVWDFSLPATPTFQTAFGSPAGRLRGYYGKRAAEGVEKEPADWDAVDAQCAQMLSEHRFNATPSFSFRPQAQDDGTFRIPPKRVDDLREFVDRYQVNAMPIPHPKSVIKDPQADRDKLHAWLKAWDIALDELNRPDVDFFIYLRDEPNDEEAYRYVQDWGTAIRAAKSRVKVMVVEQTKTQNPEWGDLYGAVDTWCPLFPLFDVESASKRLALGEKIWTYTALCQGKEPTPWWETDFPLLNYRVPAWIAWRYQLTGLLYWGGMTYWNDVSDPWTEPITLNRRDRRKDGKGPVYNGEGSLVYPARAVGYEGIAPSLRVKALRDSFQDYEYLAILERAGLRDEAMKIVLEVADSWTKWDPDPAAYEAARARLAELIVKQASGNKTGKAD